MAFFFLLIVIETSSITAIIDNSVALITPSSLEAAVSIAPGDPLRSRVPLSPSGPRLQQQVAEPEPPALREAPLRHLATVNVGGRLFYMLPQTVIQHEPTSLPARVLAGQEESPGRDEQDLPFFDRDAYLFEFVLAFVRTGRLTYPPIVRFVE